MNSKMPEVRGGEVRGQKSVKRRPPFAVLRPPRISLKAEYRRTVLRTSSQSMDPSLGRAEERFFVHSDASVTEICFFGSTITSDSNYQG